MTKDIDDVLRRMAERDRPTPEDQARVWARVQQLADQPRPRRRAWRWLVAMAAAVAVLLVGFMVQRNVGTEDFTLRQAPRSDSGVRVFESERGYYDIRLENLSTDSPEAQALAEEIRAKSAAGERRLIQVYGFTIAEKTVLTGAFEVQTHLGPRRFSVDLGSPTGEQLKPKDQAVRARFMAEHAAEAPRAVREGRARDLGSQSIIAWDIQVSCRRWAIVLPDYGTIIYWSGEPSP